MNRTDTDGDCRSLVREVTIRISEQSQKLSELRKEITAYTGNFSEDNVFAFKTSFSDDKEYMDFACDLKEFIDEDKVSEYQSRINTRNSDIFRQITSDTKSMVSQEGNIRGVVDQITPFQGEELRRDYPVYRDAYRSEPEQDRQSVEGDQAIQ